MRDIGLLPRLDTASEMAEPALFRRTKLNVDFDSNNFETRQVHVLLGMK